MAWALELGAAVSAFGSALASAAGCARLIYAMARDARPDSRLATVTQRTSAPGAALAFVMVFSVLALLILVLAGNTGLDIWDYMGTLGTLLLLVTYALINVGAVRLVLTGRSTVQAAACVGPALAVLFLAFVLFNQVYPAPPVPFNLLPYMCIGWLALGLLIVLIVPGLAKRIGRGLAVEEGLIADQEAKTEA